MEQGVSEEVLPIVFTNESSARSFMCALCNGALRNPYTADCGHSFCKLCVSACWTKEVEVVCPECNHPLKSVIPNRLLAGLMGNELIHCRYGLKLAEKEGASDLIFTPDPTGCQELVVLSDRERHESICPFLVGNCPNVPFGCDVCMVRLVELQTHLSDCTHMPLLCTFSPDTCPPMSKDAYDDHVRLKPCGKCDMLLPSCMAGRHKLWDCEGETCFCPNFLSGCRARLVRANLWQHLLAECNEEPLQLLGTSLHREWSHLQSEIGRVEGLRLKLMRLAQRVHTHQKQTHTAVHVNKAKGSNPNDIEISDHGPVAVEVAPPEEEGSCSSLCNGRKRKKAVIEQDCTESSASPVTGKVAKLELEVRRDRDRLPDSSSHRSNIASPSSSLSLASDHEYTHDHDHINDNDNYDHSHDCETCTHRGNQNDRKKNVPKVEAITPGSSGDGLALPQLGSVGMLCRMLDEGKVVVNNRVVYRLHGVDLELPAAPHNPLPLYSHLNALNEKKLVDIYLFIAGKKLNPAEHPHVREILLDVSEKPARSQSQPSQPLTECDSQSEVSENDSNSLQDEESKHGDNFRWKKDKDDRDDRDRVRSSGNGKERASTAYATIFHINYASRVWKILRRPCTQGKYANEVMGNGGGRSERVESRVEDEG